MGLGWSVGTSVRRRYRQRRWPTRVRASGGHPLDRHHVYAGGGIGGFRHFRALHFAAIIGSFVAGTVLSGFLIQDSTLQLGRRYGVALLLESLLLCAAVPLLYRDNSFGIYSASCACGLQNAMVSTYSGAVVRTTHLSGMFTDLGIFLGHAIRGLLGYASLFIPGGLTALTSIAYGLYDIRKSRNA